jgi:hypothetical protein
MDFSTPRRTALGPAQRSSFATGLGPGSGRRGGRCPDSRHPASPWFRIAADAVSCGAGRHGRDLRPDHRWALPTRDCSAARRARHHGSRRTTIRGANPGAASSPRWSSLLRRLVCFTHLALFLAACSKAGSAGNGFSRAWCALVAFVGQSRLELLGTFVLGLLASATVAILYERSVRPLLNTATGATVPRPRRRAR